MQHLKNRIRWKKFLFFILAIPLSASFFLYQGSCFVNEDKILYNDVYAKLKIIQIGINAYKNDYGEYPYKLNLLIPNYLSNDDNAFICPTSTSMPGKFCFIFNTTSQPYWLLRTPKPLYKNINSKTHDKILGYIILYTDGKIKWNSTIPVLSKK